jgi:hypothetical protein
MPSENLIPATPAKDSPSFCCLASQVTTPLFADLRLVVSAQAVAHAISASGRDTCDGHSSRLSGNKKIEISSLIALLLDQEHSSATAMQRL